MIDEAIKMLEQLRRLRGAFAVLEELPDKEFNAELKKCQRITEVAKYLATLKTIESGRKSAQTSGKEA